jgi:hypothetical protein
MLCCVIGPTCGACTVLLGGASYETLHQHTGYNEVTLLQTSSAASSESLSQSPRS